MHLLKPWRYKGIAAEAIQACKMKRRTCPRQGRVPNHTTVYRHIWYLWHFISVLLTKKVTLGCPESHQVLCLWTAWKLDSRLILALLMFKNRKRMRKRARHSEHPGSILSTLNPWKTCWPRGWSRYEREGQRRSSWPATSPVAAVSVAPAPPLHFLPTPSKWQRFTSDAFTGAGFADLGWGTRHKQGEKLALFPLTMCVHWNLEVHQGCDHANALGILDNLSQIRT